MTIGYARISTTDQNLGLQHDALKAAGCETIFSDEASGAKEARPGLDQVLSHLRSGDTLVIWRFDRLGRSLKHLLSLVESFKAKGIHLRSLSEGIDTSTPMGTLVFQVSGAFAEFERALIQERTNAGLASARLRGKKGGRPPGLSKKAADTSRIAASLYQENKLSVAEICEQLHISKATLYRYLAARGVKIGK